MKTAHCPSCGAPVEFRSSASILAICEFCRTTLMRSGEGIENLGRMAELLDDPSLIQLGVEGRYRNTHFAVIGRIQLQYPQGLWNEWYVLFDNQRAGWLGEASGQFTLTFLMPPNSPLPARASLAPGSKLELGGHEFTVTDLEEGHCIAGEGELPFRVGAGFPASTADMRCGKVFATLDYSEDPPLWFVGEAVEFSALQFTGLRAAPVAGEVQARALRCPSCGAPFAITAAGVKSVACGSCHAILDAEDPDFKILSRFESRFKIEPSIPLGSEGQFEGQKFRLIGFLERGTQGPVRYTWREYLLHHPDQGFRWLTESRGHWGWVTPLASNPTPARDRLGRETLLHDGIVYKHFESSKADVGYVVGEFYWRVSVGESCLVSDYIAPPHLISEEKSENEVLWSLSQYLEPEVLKRAFGLKTPLLSPQGVAPHQPCPYEAGSRLAWRSFRWASVAAMLIQLFFVLIAQNKEVFSTSLNLPAGKSAEPFSTEGFRLSGRPGNVAIDNQAQIDNDWLYLDMTLVNRDTGETFEVGREIDYYHGCDEECWNEGANSDQAIISSVPAGNYYFLIESETRSNIPQAITDRLTVRRDVPGWSNFFLTELGLLIFPLFYLWRKGSFERERWAGSDHPFASAGGDDD
ncbi:MAG: DUF4178 domain-containing protein [Methylococcaceae bacterium]|nr:DUF4178 domain-containing protein [Methylococcaceae bacterium]